MLTSLISNASIIVGVGLMLAWLSGPLGLFAAIRGLTASGGLLSRLSPNERYHSLLMSLNEGQNCPFCIGFWVGWLVTYRPGIDLYTWAYSALAAIGLAYIPICFLYFAKSGLFK